MMCHIQGTRKWIQCIDNFSDVDFLEDNSTDSDEANTLLEQIVKLKGENIVYRFLF